MPPAVGQHADFISPADGAALLAGLPRIPPRALPYRGHVLQEFDLDAALWVIPPERMKMRAEHRVPLSRQAVEVLRAVLDGLAENAGEEPVPTTGVLRGAHAGIGVALVRSTLIGGRAGEHQPRANLANDPSSPRRP